MNQNETQQEEPKEFEFVKDIEFEITHIEITTAIQTKVTFSTNKGNITWKPKAEITENYRGIPVKKKIDATPDTLPDKLYEIQQVIHKNGSCKVKGSYTILKTKMDGEPKEYRFIKGINPLETWAIIEEKPEEQVG